METLFLSLFALAIIVLIALRIYTVRLQSAHSRAIDKFWNDLCGLSINLEASNKRSLFILLAADGSINRLGTGTLDNRENELLIGKTDPAVFQTVKTRVSTALFQYLGGTFPMKNPVGASCRLTIAFQFSDNSANGFVFLYGSQSTGPPMEVADLVRAAVLQTDPWYQSFKRATTRRN
jgi:hypothetical protein